MAKNEEKKKETQEKEKKKKKKSKFQFKCTRCDSCCLERGPIPLTMWDLEMWARNDVIANFMSYIDVYQKPDGGFDLIIKPTVDSEKQEKDEAQPQPPFGENVPIEDLLDKKCPLYNEEKEKCLVYENRPLSCRTYPLEYDGKNFSVVDLECPGIGEEGMTKEELIQMRDNAQLMYKELTRIRIGLPVLYQIISNNFMQELMKQQMQAMEAMSDEDKQKLEEIMKKSQPAQG
ncbi:MAG: YkgJ family cysteine cluster protein [Promethearchaeia archaeon]